MTKKIKKILIFRFGAIGDVVHSTALYRSLKKNNPDLSIHYLTTQIPALLINNDPDLDKVWTAEKKSYKYLNKIAKNLRKENFDLCINLQPSIRTRIFSFLINSKINITYKKNFKFHAVENFWKTAKPLFPDIILDKELKLYISEEIQEKMPDLIKDENIIGFNMGVSGTRQGRRWSLEYWRQLAYELVNKHNFKIILTGSKEDIEFSENLLDISPDIESFCGKLNIAENAALISKCKLIVSGDTGPLHIATAVGTPSIGLYGAAPVSRTGPYGKNTYTFKSDRKCVPCNRRKCRYIKPDELYTPCLEDITPDEIIKIIEKINHE